MTPTPHSRAPSFPRDYAAPASPSMRRGGTYSTAPARGYASGLTSYRGGCAVECPGTSLSTSPAVFPRAAGGFQPLSGGEADLSALTPREATSGLKARRQPHLPSAATAFAPGCSPRCPGMAGCPDGKVRGRAALDSSPAASSGQIPGPRDSAQASSRGAASSWAGSQPVAVDAANRHGRRAYLHRDATRKRAAVSTTAAASRPIRHGAGSAAPRGRSIAGKDNGLCPEIPACSTVQTQLAGAARPGPFPGRA